MVSNDLIPDISLFHKLYPAKLPSSPEKSGPEDLSELKKDTMKSFGDEWKTWSRFGWDNHSTMEQTVGMFEYKVLVKKGELNGKLVLDAGCGNGRYTKAAEMYGGEVIGVDISDAVDAAYENTKNEKKIHIVQGDLFKLPFRKNLFDFIFSNGVLMHTGDARKAFLSILSHLKDDGAITIHLYHKGNFIYEFNDRWLRLITTRLPIPLMYKISNIITGFANLFPKKIAEYGFPLFVHLERHSHYNFDWYIAPIATHHTYAEVYGWLKDAGLYLVKDHNITRHPWRKFILPFFFLTVKAQRKNSGIPPEHTLS